MPPTPYIKKKPHETTHNLVVTGRGKEGEEKKAQEKNQKITRHCNAFGKLRRKKKKMDGEAMRNEKEKNEKTSESATKKQDERDGQSRT